MPEGTKIVLFGNKNNILTELKSHNFSENVFDIVDCIQVIDMGEHVKTLKQKPKSSISVGFHYLSSGKIDGFEVCR